MRADVLVVGPFPPPVYGESRVTGMVAQQLRGAGLRVDVVDTAVGRDRKDLAYHLGRARLNARAAAAILGPRAPRSVYLAGAGGAGLVYLILLTACCRLRGLRVALHHHSFAYLHTHSALMAVLARLGGTRMLHVTLSATMAERLRASYSGVRRTLVASNAGLLPGAVPSPVSSPVPGAVREAGPARVGHLGNLVAAKGVGTSLATARTLIEEGRDLRMVLAGPALEPEAERAVEEARHAIGDRLDYLGPLTPDRVDEFMASLDLLLFPSTYVNEAEPLVVLEAARHGVPAVAFDIGCLADIVAPPGRVVPVGGDFTGAVRAVLDAGPDPAGRAQVAGAFERRRSGALATVGEMARWLLEPVSTP